MLNHPIAFAAVAVVVCFIAFAVRQLRLPLDQWLLASAVSGGAVGAIGVALGPAASSSFRALLVPLLLAIVLVWIRWFHVDRDYVDGLITGLLIGSVAASIIGLARNEESASLAVVLEGALAGLMSHLVLLRTRGARILFAVGVIALVVVFQQALGETLRASWQAASLLVTSIAVASMGATVLQWRALRAELEKEAELGVFPASELDGLVHPIRRMQKSGWADENARREFVRLATELAIRKTRQRRMDGSMARLHQVEVLKLRQLLGDVLSVELSVRRDKEEGSDGDESF